MALDIVEIGPEAFTDSRGEVINWRGDNFFKACGVLVVRTRSGTTSCVKRKNHAGRFHEDFYGNEDPPRG